MPSDFAADDRDTTMEGGFGIGFAELVADASLDHPFGRAWWMALAVALALCGLLAASLIALAIQGVGIWGNNVPVTWALDIVSYDWWIGIACGGLFVSVLPVLANAPRLAVIGRMGVTAGLCAAIAAGLYPIIHLGRPWFFYWNLPYPNTLLLWPQFRSPLVWDAFDILGYLVVAGCTWYVSLLPDLAATRDRAVERMLARRGTALRAQIYGIAALGWRGSAMHWQRLVAAQGILAIFAVLIVVTLQIGASVMFAGTPEPGWHDALLPVANVVSALSQGVAVTTLCAVALRRALNLGAVVTETHLEWLAWGLLILGLACAYCFFVPGFDTMRLGSAVDRAALGRRFTGNHAWAAWTMILCACLPAHLFWWRRFRRSQTVLALVAASVCIGVFADHFMIIVDTLQQDFLPPAAQPYAVDAWELATLAGTGGLFLLLLLLAARFLPVIALRSLSDARNGADA